MGSKTFGNKPDIRVKLFFSEIKPNEEEEAKKPKDDSVELLFGECSKLDAERPKHIRDWKKLLRSKRDKQFLGCSTNDRALVVNDHISVSVLDSVGGKVYIAYEVLDLTIPLKVSDRKSVEDLLTNAIKLKTYFEGVADEVVRLMNESKALE
ncbi:7265_t:CDS:2 [Paraglomus brasilianum]|uniref:7265_t:CDS:1 n=1 Tax=Paraglomus brasilianum TaxID=144538 RepID=A0A9N8W0V5_9GLOM|nr:7265_t:CDS:2 [Paraglomus brasilianum]